MKYRAISFISWVVVILCSIVISSIEVQARLLVVSPKHMIESLNLIFVGKVVEKSYSEEKRKVRLEVKCVLKGNLDESELTLEREKPVMYGWLGFDFPDVGSKVFVLLDKSDKEYSTVDVNYVATINDDGNIQLYNGMTMNSYTPEKYAEEYESFYKENMKKIVSSPQITEKLLERENNVNSQVIKNENNIKSIIVSIGCLLLVVICALIILFKRKKDLNKSI